MSILLPSPAEQSASMLSPPATEVRVNSMVKRVLTLASPIDLENI